MKLFRWVEEQDRDRMLRQWKAKNPNTPMPARANTTTELNSWDMIVISSIMAMYPEAERLRKLDDVERQCIAGLMETKRINDEKKEKIARDAERAKAEDLKRRQDIWAAMQDSTDEDDRFVDKGEDIYSDDHAFSPDEESPVKPKKSKSRSRRTSSETFAF